MASFFKHRRKPVVDPTILATEPVEPAVRQKRRVFPVPEEKISPGVALEYMLQGGIVLIGNPMHPGMIMRIHLSQSRLSAQVETRTVRSRGTGRWKMWHGRLELFVTYREIYRGGIPKTALGEDTPQQSLALLDANKRLRRRIELERTSGWLFDAAVPTPSAMRKRRKTLHENTTPDAIKNRQKDQ